MTGFLVLFTTIVSLCQVETETKLVIPPHFPFLKDITFSSTQKGEINWLRNGIEAQHGRGQERVRISRYTYRVHESAWSHQDRLVEVVQLDDGPDSFRSLY